MSLNVLIACEDATLNARLLAALQAEPAQATSLTYEEAEPARLQERLRTLRHDVLVLDCPGNTQQLERRVAAIRVASPKTHTVVVTDHPDDERDILLMRSGVAGTLRDTDIANSLRKVISAVQAGQPWYSRSVMYRAVHSLGNESTFATQRGDPTLTPREQEILRLIGSGLTSKEVALHLKISYYTVKTHLHHLYVKLNKSGRFKAFLAPPEREGSRPSR